MKLGFTGTRFGMSAAQKSHLNTFLWWICKHHQDNELHHGDCVGADTEAHESALRHEFKLILHPPLDPMLRAYCVGAYESFPPTAYIERNHRIVNRTEMLIVAPCANEETLRSGTWATKRYAEKTGKPFYILPR